MKDNMNTEILCENIILCEGEDEKWFLNYYLNSQERNIEDSRFATSVHTLSFGGNEELKNYLRTIRLVRGFNKVKTMLIIRDAETDCKKAAEQIKTALEKAEFVVPEKPGQWTDAGFPRCAFLLFPSLCHYPKNGTLEHLCMRIIKESYNPEEILSRIKEFMDILKTDGLRRYDHEFKSQLHGFYSVSDPFVGMKIGETAKAGAFDWNNAELEGLNQCLKEAFLIAESAGDSNE